MSLPPNVLPLDLDAWSRRTAHLSPHAAGVYLRLVAWAWVNKRPLPGAAAPLARIGGWGTTDEAVLPWEQVWNEIADYFEPADAEGGGVHDLFVLELRAKADALAASDADFRERQAAAGRASAAARGNQRATTGQPVDQPHWNRVDLWPPDPMIAPGTGVTDLATGMQPVPQPVRQPPRQPVDLLVGRPVRLRLGSDEVPPEQEQYVPLEPEQEEPDQEHYKHSAAAEDFSTGQPDGNQMATGDRRAPLVSAVLVKLAHTVIDESPTNELDVIEVMEALKRKAAMARVPYDSAAARAAIDMAIAQQRKLDLTGLATRLVVDALEAQGGRPLSLADLNVATDRLMRARYGATMTAEQASTLRAKLWSRALLEAQPDVFRIQGKELDQVVLTRRRPQR